MGHGQIKFGQRAKGASIHEDKVRTGTNWGCPYYQTGLTCQSHSKPSSEMPRLAAEKGFIHEAAKQGDRRMNLKSASLEARG